MTDSPDARKMSAKAEQLSADLARRYKGEMESVLGPDLMAEVDWRHEDPDFKKIVSDYYAIWNRQEGGHKKYSYFALYDRLFSPYRNKRATMLELGIYKGASLKSWQEFLGEGCTIIGVDINPACIQFDAANAGRHVRIGNQLDQHFLTGLGAEFGLFDIVIDDASHKTNHQIACFNTLFARYVAPGGIYFIEDTNTSLWPEYRQGAKDIFDFIKALGLATHIFYADHYYSDYRQDQHPKTFRTLAAAKLIEEVRIVDAGVAIYKAKNDHYPPLVGRR